MSPRNSWSSNLLDWYDKHKRQMPWRSDSPNPYRVWISEIMLQQTQVTTVIPYFERFMKRFPTVQELAKVEQQELLKYWEGLGYYSRARNLHKAAKLISDDYNGQLPDNYTDLLAVPGLGPYTAAAIASIAFDQAIPVVDGNVLRVFTRYWGLYDDIRKNDAKDKIRQKLQPDIKQHRAGDFNQAIMELGALVCKPKSPDCQNCPISHECYALANNKINELPFKSTKAKTPHYDVAVALIKKGNQYLLQQRPENGLLGAMWEWPGGKQLKAKSLEASLIEKVKHQNGLSIVPGKCLFQVKHAYSHFKITLHVYEVIDFNGRLKSNGISKAKWMTIKEINAIPLGKTALTVLGEIDQ